MNLEQVKGLFKVDDWSTLRAALRALAELFDEPKDPDTVPAARVRAEDLTDEPRLP